MADEQADQPGPRRLVLAEPKSIRSPRPAQLVHLVGYALVVNSVALHRCRRRLALAA